VSRASALGLALALAVCGGAARAQTSGADKATAQSLFDDARKLEAADRWAEACPKLAESQRLDPSMGTQFYLAECLEHVGRITTAWSNYLEVADAARAAGLAERDRYARARADALKPRLPRLAVKVSDEAARAPGFALTRDGEALGAAQRGASIPVDPGEHVITATATGKKSWSATVRVAEAGTLDVAVPALEDDPAAATTPPAPPPETTEGRPALRLAGFVVGAAGLVGVGIGAGLGAVAIQKRDASNAGGHCDAADTCDPIGKGLRRDSLNAANGSTAAIVLGTAAVAGGVVMLVIGTRKAPDAAVAVKMGPGSLSLQGRF
jgi:hypothetical protein